MWIAQYEKEQRHFWHDLPIRCTIVALAAVRRRLDDGGDDSKFVPTHHALQRRLEKTGGGGIGDRRG